METIGGDLREVRKLNAARLGALKERYPEAAMWLAEVETDLLPAYLRRLSSREQRWTLRPARRGGAFGREMRLYTFVEPGVWSREEAEAWLRKPHRWNELWAAAHLIETYGPRISGVRLYLLPVLGAPIDVFDASIGYVWRQMASRQQKAARAYARFAAGDVSPKPGFVCRECRVFDLCRVGRR